MVKQRMQALDPIAKHGQRHLCQAGTLEGVWL